MSCVGRDNFVRGVLRPEGIVPWIRIGRIAGRLENRRTRESLSDYFDVVTHV